jgi:hypothetical protein
MIAELLTQHHGEYVFRIGAQPPHNKLFAGELSDDADGWTGVSRTEAELDWLHQEITRTVEEVGGKVCRKGHPDSKSLKQSPQDLSSF